MDDQRISYTVHQVIKNHGRSSKHPQLNSQNERRIIQKISASAKLRDELLDVVNKRDYYIKKLNRLLEKTIEGETRVVKPAIEPHLIADRTQATAYLKQVITDDPRTVSRLKEEIAHQHKLQEQWKAEREEIVEKYRLLKEATTTKVLKKLEGYHPSKADKIRDGMMAEALNEWQAKYETELQAYDEKVMSMAHTIATKNINTLETLKIPFFCIEKEYPELKNDRIYILEEIQKTIT